MAHKLSAGSTRLGRDSNAQRLGIKLYAGEKAKAGSIIVRQRGTKYHLGENVKLGKDDTIFSLVEGVVKFSKRKMKKFDNNFKTSTVVNVITSTVA